MNTRNSILAAAAFITGVSAFAPAPVHAQTALSVAIDRCSRGDMSACNSGNQMAIQRRQQQIYNTVPAAAGKGAYVPCVARSVCGTVGGNALPGNWGWSHQLYGDIKHNYPQVWCNLFRNAC